jgi:hypothetical protein
MELAGMGNVDQLKAANKALATEFATANKSLASGAAEATALEKAIAAAPARETRGLPNDATPRLIWLLRKTSNGHRRARSSSFRSSNMGIAFTTS